jgi:predicted nucleotidyltransferase component of viral defense system
MIPLIEINHVAASYRVAAETIEKDYVISWILLCLSKSVLMDDFIFYGGTAIKRMYFEEHRFSEDIDLLSTRKFSLDFLLKALTGLEYAREKANILLEINKDDIIATNDRVQLYVNYSGYDEIIGSPKKIRLDFSMGMQLNGKVVNTDMIASYSDLKKQSVYIPAMTLNTILANKLGLLIDLTRNEPRDLFDIWFLLQRLDKFDYDFNQVCEAFKERFCFRPSLSTLIPFLKNRMLKIHWDVRLSKQVAELPNVDRVIDDVELKLRELFIQT